MRKRIPAGLINRAEKVIKELGVKKKRPVAMFPRLVSVSEWSAVAEPMQQRLKDNIKQDTPVDYSDIPKLELVASK